MDRPPAIKICGIRTVEAARAAVEAGAQYIGLVFIDGSPRQVGLEQARAVARAVRPAARVVGLFRDVGPDFQPPDFLDVLQLYGPWPEPWAGCWAGRRLIKPLAWDPVQLADQLARWDELARQSGRLEAVLVDTPDPQGVGGGTGRSFDWPELAGMLETMELEVRLGLAGGLRPDNVVEAIRLVRPAMVDVSSGVESQRGVKDVAKIRAFCRAVQSAGRTGQGG